MSGLELCYNHPDDVTTGSTPTCAAFKWLAEQGFVDPDFKISDCLEMTATMSRPDDNYVRVEPVDRSQQRKAVAHHGCPPLAAYELQTGKRIDFNAPS